MIAKKNQPQFYSVWPTAWGPMGAVAGPGGVSRVVLPHYPSDQLAELLAWEHSGAKRDNGPFEQLIELSRDYFNGQSVDFEPIKCALPSEGSFSGRVLRGCMKIGYGQTESYGRRADHQSRGGDPEDCP